VASDQGLVQATACAIVDKLNKSDITPLDLLDVLERRIAEVDGQVNALPTLCFDRARSHAKELMKKPVGERGLLAACRCRSRISPMSRGKDHAGLTDLQGQHPGPFRYPGRTSRT